MNPISWPIIFLFLLNFAFTYLNAQSVESNSLLKTQDLVLEVSCDKTEFIQGEPINILIETINKTEETIRVFPNNYLYNKENGSTSKHSFDRGLTIQPLEKYYLFIDPADWMMFLGSIDSAHSLKPGNYEFYVTTTYSNTKYESNKIILVVNPVPDSLLQAYNDLKYIPDQPRSIEASEKLLEKYKGSFYEERFYDKVFGYGFYYNAIKNEEDFKDYRNKAINLYREFILKYPNSSNAYTQFRVIMYNYKDNALLVNEILSSLNYNQPNCKLLEILRNQQDYFYKEIKYLLN